MSKVIMNSSIFQNLQLQVQRVQLLTVVMLCLLGQTLRVDYCQGNATSIILGSQD